MKSTFWMFIVFATIVACSCDEAPNDKKAQDRVRGKEESVNKRQTGQEANPGLQHIQYGASPGHYVLKSKQDETEFPIEYINSVKKLLASNIYKAALAAENKQIPAAQQYAQIQRNPRPYQQQQALKEPKYVNQPIETEQQIYIDDNSKYFVPPSYPHQPRVPLVLRPSQAVKASPSQGIYTSHGYIPIDGQGSHEARVSAALSVADNKPQVFPQQQQQRQYRPVAYQSAFPDSSFEKELAELVAANQAAEAKERPQHNYYQLPPQNVIQSAPVQHVPKKLPQIKIIKQQAPSHSNIVPLARSKNPAPQQYLIETTRPQASQTRPIVVQKVKPQYIQQYTSEEPVYAEYQPVEHKSALRVVSAPKLQTPQSPLEYEPAPEKQTHNSPPAYLKYYQSIRPQQEEVEAPKEVRIGSYQPKYNVPKPQPQPHPAQQIEQQPQPQYYIQYQPQAKPEDPSTNYVRYEAAKPQLVEYSNENEAFLRAIYQSQSEKAQTVPTTSERVVKIPPKTSPQPTNTREEARSSIYVSKSIQSKKPEKSVKILNPTPSEQPEEVPTVRLPPPKNNKVYTQEEFQALVAAGYSVTPVPVIDDDGTQAKFSSPPPSYPGYQAQYANAVPEEQQYYQKEESEQYTAPTSSSQVIRKRKQRRPTNAPQYRADSLHGASETQSQLQYTLPLETQETLNYGTRKQPRVRSVSSS